MFYLLLSYLDLSITKRWCYS